MSDLAVGWLLLDQASIAVLERRHKAPVDTPFGAAVDAVDVVVVHCHRVGEPSWSCTAL